MSVSIRAACLSLSLSLLSHSSFFCIICRCQTNYGKVNCVEKIHIWYAMRVDASYCVCVCHKPVYMHLTATLRQTQHMLRRLYVCKCVSVCVLVLVLTPRNAFCVTMLHFPFWLQYAKHSHTYNARTHTHTLSHRESRFTHCTLIFIIAYFQAGLQNLSVQTARGLKSFNSINLPRQRAELIKYNTLPANSLCTAKLLLVELPLPLLLLAAFASKMTKWNASSELIKSQLCSDFDFSLPF